MDKFPIADLLPHDHPMVLLDRVVQATAESLTAAVTITADSPFFMAQGVPAWVGIEYMGQAVAAFAGYQARVSQNPVKIGFLVSTRKYESPIGHFPEGSTITITVEPITEASTGLQVFAALLKVDEWTIRANLNVFMPDNASAFLQGESHA